MSKLRRTRTRVQTSVVALVTAAFVAGVALVAVGLTQSPASATLTSGFSITSTIYTTPSDAFPAATCSGTPALLYPGVTRCVVFTVTNNLKAPITVQSITIALDSAYPASPSGCSASNLNLPSFSGSFTVAPSGATAKSPGLAISLKDSGTNQDNCKGATLHFKYSGTAIYTELYATSTAVTSSQNPSTVGHSVTYTATVSASATAAQDPVPSSPTGTVTFYDGAVAPANIIPGCSAVALPVSTPGVASAAAQCVSSTYATAGTHSITAVFTPSPYPNNNFATSTSPVFSQVVNLAPTSSALNSSPNPSTFGQSVTFTATLTPTSGPTGTVNFFQCSNLACTSSFLLGTGTLSGGHATFTTTALPGGSNYLRAVYGGNASYATSTSPVITQVVNFTAACITKSVNGGYTVKSGQSICIKTIVNGGVTVQAGGALFLSGATINGGVTSTGATTVQICGSTVNGGITVSGTTGFVLIGDGSDDGAPGCAGNTIKGGLSLTKNLRGFEVAASSITGGASVTGNTGTGPATEDAVPEVEGNAITGGLSCATSNIPALSNGGQKNTVSGTKSGQCSAAGF